MTKSLRKLALSCALLLGSACAFAGEKNTPLQAFIDREKGQHEFVTVSTLWQQSDRFSAAATEPFVKGAQILDIDPAQLAKLASEKPQAITLTVANPNGGTYEVELARFDFLSKDFKVQLNEANGVKKMVDYAPGAYYRGVVKGVEGSMAAFCFFSNEAYGTFSTPADGNIVIEPNTLTGAPAGSYLLYADREMKIRPQGKCGTDDRLPEFKKVPKQNKNAYATCKDVEIYFLADNATYNSFNQNVTTLGNYITSVFNVTAALYRNEGIYVSIRYMEVNGGPDAYSMLSQGSSNFLYEFADQIQNTQVNIQGADMAMLLSTRYGGMGGVAFLDQLCFGMPASFANINKTAPGNFPTYTWNSHMITHEFGHTIGSPHTHACEWNGNYTAIDACTTVEGWCPNPVPAYPTGGGTIMSYCHFQSVGVNFSKGFGTQPGDLIRDYVYSAPCAEIRLVTQPTADNNKMIVANRECTDENNVTWYWNDNSNVEEEDDVLALAIKKSGSNIGSLDESGFAVKSGTINKYKSGKADTLTGMPAGTGLKNTNVALARYWSVTPKTQPGGEIEILFPFIAGDVADIDGSVPNAGPITNGDLTMYMTINGRDANPEMKLNGTTAADIKTYTNSSIPSTTTWASQKYGDTVLAKFKVTNLNGGGTLVYSYSADPNKIQSIFNNEDKAVFYPNPTHNSWNVWVPNSGSNINFGLYTVDGRMVKEMKLLGNSVNEIDATTLAAGLYYYRISSETATYTGSLQKK